MSDSYEDQEKRVEEQAMNYLREQFESPEVYAEFGGDFKRFVAFKMAEAGGRVKIYGQSVIKKAEAVGLNRTALVGSNGPVSTSESSADGEKVKSVGYKLDRAQLFRSINEMNATRRSVF